MPTVVQPPQPFTIDVPQSELDDLRARLHNTRFAPELENDHWEYGTNNAYLRELVTYWADEFDWRATERAMNELPQYTVQIDEFTLHYIHVKSPHPNAMPLLIHHGWPWTFWDLKKVFGPLSDPTAHGGNAEDAFDVVLVSLPGFGFSSPLGATGANFHVTADLEVTLMTEVLGYERFATSGGDLGAFVVTQLGHKHPDVLFGVHTHLPVQLSRYGPEHLDAVPGITYDSMFMPTDAEYSEEEREWPKWNREFFGTEQGYSMLQRTKPQTLATLLNDSPAGQLSWVLEKRRSWAHLTDDDVESVWDKDHLCVSAMIYWITQTGGSSARFYREQQYNAWKPERPGFPIVTAPTALSISTHDVYRLPRKWAEAYYNVQQYRVHEQGGHFFPYERPENYLADVRDFFRTFRALEL